MTIALIYHDLADPEEADEIGFPGPLAARYKLTPAVFEDHLDAIRGSGAGIGLVEAGGQAPAAALTFDDGGGSALTAADALERHGWRGHFFVTTARIGTPGFLTAEGVRDLARRGHSVGSHSHTHPTYMGKLAAAEIEREWRLSRSILTDVLGEPPASASVPGGFLSPAVVSLAEAAGYTVLMTSEPTARRRLWGGLLVLGRYTIWSSTPAERAAAYARGARGARARLWAEWNAKGLGKRLSPAAYQALRRLRARRP